MESSSCDKKVVGADEFPRFLESGPDFGVTAGDREVEVDDFDPREYVLDEIGAGLAAGWRCPGNTMEQLGSGDRGQEKGLVGVEAEERRKIQAASLGGDEDRGIEDQSHFETSFGSLRRAAAMSRERAEASSEERWRIPAQEAARSRPVAGRRAGRSFTIGRPPLTRRAPSPW